MNAFGFASSSTCSRRAKPALRGDTDAVAEEAIRRGAGALRSPVRRRRRRRRVLRPQARHQRARCDRPQMAARNRASRLRLAGALRAELSRKRRPGPYARHDPPRACRFDGALLRHPHRALRRRLSRLACARASRRHADLRAPARIRTRSRGAAGRHAGFRVEVDESNEKLGYKIRHWKTQKVPYILVVGKQEAADGTVNVNQRGAEEKRTVSVDAFADELRACVTERA